MNQKPRFSMPPGLLLLDFIGALSAAFGIVETTNPGTLLSAHWIFPFYNWVLIIIGALLMLPLVLHMVAIARGQNQPNERQDPVRRSKR
ncbi:MAG: hypothetical protein KJ558_12275 [Gammaproteobacteria bacterium]|nr:hypothetical protein [Gammaproteobacteria bacterium]MBU1655579.1 hypothetical protein [Gammaproteobacteria bacterium]MBU1960276.1 hypothetical protein [Gammaproteobacteria bacterium]